MGTHAQPRKPKGQPSGGEFDSKSQSDDDLGVLGSDNYHGYPDTADGQWLGLNDAATEGDVQRAAAHLRRALELDPDLSDVVSFDPFNPGTIRVVDEQGRPHNDDGPATLYGNGTRIWMRHGAEHRADGPSTIGWTGTMTWSKDGVAYWTEHADPARDEALKAEEARFDLALERATNAAAGGSISTLADQFRLLHPNASAETVSEASASADEYIRARYVAQKALRKPGESELPAACLRAVPYDEYVDRAPLFNIEATPDGYLSFVAEHPSRRLETAKAALVHSSISANRAAAMKRWSEA